MFISDIMTRYIIWIAPFHRGSTVGMTFIYPFVPTYTYIYNKYTLITDTPKVAEEKHYKNYFYD